MSKNPTMSVRPKNHRFKVGKLYRAILFNQQKDVKKFTLLYNPLDQMIGNFDDGAIVIYLDEPEWGFFKVVVNDMIGYAYISHLEEVS